MRTRLEFILVTGANATGKTTLIEKNRITLESAGFQIIIPDNLLKYATEHTDAFAVIREHVEEAFTQKKNFVLETPFQFESIGKMIDRIQKAGYDMSMYQLFVNDAGQSATRVQARFKTGGLYINSDEVRNNFNANMKNVGEQFGRFDHSYFIDNSTNKRMKLSAEFAKGKLIRLQASDNFYLRKLFQQKNVTKLINKNLLKTILANKNYPELLPKRSSGSRLKL